MEHCILQNNAINIYELYFDEDDTIPVCVNYPYKTLNIFRDPGKKKLPIQQISWSPDGGTHIAASYCNLAFQPVIHSNTNSYIWNVGNQT